MIRGVLQDHLWTLNVVFTSAQRPMIDRLTIFSAQEEIAHTIADLLQAPNFEGEQTSNGGDCASFRIIRGQMLQIKPDRVFTHDEADVVFAHALIHQCLGECRQLRRVEGRRDRTIIV